MQGSYTCQLATGVHGMWGQFKPQFDRRQARVVVFVLHNRDGYTAAEPVIR